jgi:hypothetical protein
MDAEMKRYEIDIQGGRVVQRATVIVSAANRTMALEIADKMCLAMDPTAYVNTVYEVA